MNKKLPADAFGYYLALGVSRSYSKVAKHFGVAKRTVTTLATAEKWQERVTEAEAKARDSAAESYVDTIREMNSKHLKVLQFMLAKGLEGLKNTPVDDFGSAVRAVTLAIDRERLVRGEATNRSETVEQLVKREYERYLTTAGEDETKKRRPTKEASLKQRRLDKLTLFADLGYAPHEGQLRVHRSTAQRRVLACGVRWGKSTCAAMECIAALLEPRAASLGWVVAPNYGLTQKIFQRVAYTIKTHFAHRIKVLDPRERSLSVINFAGGISQITAKSADNPDSLLGDGLDWLVCDEVARLNQEVWFEHLSQRLIDKRGWALLISTPGACDHWFFRLYKRGQKGRDPAFESWSSPSWENPHLSREMIEEERSRLPSEVFGAQYEAEFQGIDTAPCPVCENPGAPIRGMLFVGEGEEPRRCDECGGYVDLQGRGVMGRDVDGRPTITFLQFQERRDGTKCVPQRCVPGVGDGLQPKVLSGGKGEIEISG